MLRMPSIEIEIEFDMICWHNTFGTINCFFLFIYFYLFFVVVVVVVFFLFFFFTRIYLQHIARPVESDCPINIVFVRPSVHFSVVNL